MKSLVKVVCLTRDEYDILEDFLLYYGYLFGYENIVLIDNKSTDPRVLEIFEKYKSKGVTIEYDETPMGLQGSIMTRYLHKYKDTCELLLPIDTDEFLFDANSYINRTNAIDREKILHTLRNIPQDCTILQVSNYLQSIPDKNHPQFKNQKHTRPPREIVHFADTYHHISKLFFRSNAFVSVGDGQHSGNASHGYRAIVPLGFYHCHDVGERRVIEKARALLHAVYKLNVTASVEEQYVELYHNNGGYGFHRNLQYHWNLLRNIILDHFTKTYGRLPSTKQMENMVRINKQQSNEKGKPLQDVFHFLNNLERDSIEFDDHISYDDLLFHVDELSDLMLMYMTKHKFSVVWREDLSKFFATHFTA